MAESTRKLTRNLYLIDRYSHRYYTRELRKLGLSLGQFPFVDGIAENDGISQEHLSQRLGISKSTTALMVRQLLEKDIISRKMDPGDRRNFRLHLTEKGKGLLPKLEVIITACHNWITTPLTKEERRIFERLTEKICFHVEPDAFRKKL